MLVTLISSVLQEKGRLLREKEEIEKWEFGITALGNGSSKGAQKRMPTGTKGSTEIGDNTVTLKYMGVIFLL